MKLKKLNWMALLFALVTIGLLALAVFFALDLLTAEELPVLKK